MNPLLIYFQNMINSNPNMNNNPVVQNAWNAFKNKNYDELEQIANNLCQQNNVTLDDMKSTVMKKLNL